MFKIVRKFILNTFIIMSKSIVVTTGIYDLIKDQIRRKRVTQAEEELLSNELKHAKQVLRKELPNDVVTVNKNVFVKDHKKNVDKTYIYMNLNSDKKKRGTYSITLIIGIPTVRHQKGDVINWSFRHGERKIELVNVEIFSN